MEYYLLVVIKFIIGFTIILAHMNISGKTQLSQLTPIDFIGNFVLGGLWEGLFTQMQSRFTNMLLSF
ncbi:Uncharacterised protein [Proteus mirabilis]|uniref:YetF-like N-terminal transmembrane domain-containing protein n=1 Tax=Proteus mirabilis TaxID=584 RepID=A0A379FIL0_PROMI|nr:Uncharacterised protein [Proteus mirabilis]